MNVNVSVKRFLDLFSSVTPPPVSHPIVSRDPTVYSPVDAPLSIPLAAMVADWQSRCPGPLSCDKPCHEVVCSYRMQPDAGEEMCLFIHEIRSRVGALDPNDAVKIVSEYMSALIPEIREIKRVTAEAANVIQRTMQPLWVKGMFLLWGLATSVQVLSFIQMAVSQL